VVAVVVVVLVSVSVFVAVAVSFAVADADATTDADAYGNLVSEILGGDNLVAAIWAAAILGGYSWRRLLSAMICWR